MNIFNKKKDIEKLYFKGVFLAASGKYEDAENYLIKAKKISPNDKNILINLGIVFIQRLKYIEAENILKLALKIDPIDLKAWYFLGNSLTFQKKYQEAEDALKKALGIDPNDINAIKFNCHNLWSQKKYPEAETFIKNAIEVNPNNIDLWIDFGLTLANQKKYREAEDSFKKALDIDSNNIDALNALESLILEQNKNILEYEVLGKRDISESELESFIAKEIDKIVDKLIPAAINNHIKEWINNAALSIWSGFISAKKNVKEYAFSEENPFKKITARSMISYLYIGVIHFLIVYKKPKGYQELMKKINISSEEFVSSIFKFFNFNSSLIEIYSECLKFEFPVNSAAEMMGYYEFLYKKLLNLAYCRSGKKDGHDDFFIINFYPLILADTYNDFINKMK